MIETTPIAERFSLWVEFTDRGAVLRGDYENKNNAVENAKKYWLTKTGLFRAFVRDKESGDEIVFDRTYGQHEMHGRAARDG